MNKTEQGYATAFSTASYDIVTRREKELNATEDQLEVLDGIEHLWQTLVANRYHYAFRLYVEDGEVDGWTISLWDRETHTQHLKRFFGFPGSSRHVLSAINLMLEQLREEQANG